MFLWIRAIAKLLATAGIRWHVLDETILVWTLLNWRLFTELEFFQTLFKLLNIYEATLKIQSWQRHRIVLFVTWSRLTIRRYGLSFTVRYCRQIDYCADESCRFMCLSRTLLRYCGGCHPRKAHWLVALHLLRCFSLTQKVVWEICWGTGQDEDLSVEHMISPNSRRIVRRGWWSKTRWFKLECAIPYLSSY
jgi:hypothetical protein